MWSPACGSGPYGPPGAGAGAGAGGRPCAGADEVP